MLFLIVILRLFDLDGFDGFDGFSGLVFDLVFDLVFGLVFDLDDVVFDLVFDLDGLVFDLGGVGFGVGFDGRVSLTSISAILTFFLGDLLYDFTI